ncbi:MAG: class I SAM-dependent methyltransferase [Phycisphaerae bacterium]
MTEIAKPPKQRAFGRKYKTTDYATYYAQKHRSGVVRRVSTLLEARMLRRALIRLRRRHAFHTVLDCPSGAGRFLPTLAPFDVAVLALDTSESMLREGQTHYALFRREPDAVVASAFALPLPDRAVDVVLCARLLHHVSERDQRVSILREFARVARVGVVISFFDAASFRAWKRRRRNLRRDRSGGRSAIRRAQCEDEARSAGLNPIGMNALLRYHTEITAAAFLVASPPDPQ